MKIQSHKILFLSIMLMALGCKTSQLKTIQKELPSNETAQLTPCAGGDFLSDKKTLRASAVGISLDQNAASVKAYTNASQKLSLSMNQLINTVIDNSFKSTEFNNIEEITEVVNNLSRTVSSQSLKNAREICGRTSKFKDEAQNKNKYKYYIAIELGSEDLFEKLNETLSKEKSLKADYNYEKFKETFDAEMEKLNN